MTPSPPRQTHKALLAKEPPLMAGGHTCDHRFLPWNSLLMTPFLNDEETRPASRHRARQGRA